MRPRRGLRGLAALLAVPAALFWVHPLAAQCDAPLDLGEGPIGFHVPVSYDEAKPAPLLVMLHGYGVDGAIQEAYVRFRPLADEYGFLYAYPDGVVDLNGNRFWNATDACCDLFGTGFDHSAYLRRLIETIRARCNVDRYRIFVAGHSNGGFMSHRMACDHAGTIAGTASLAGVTFEDPARCRPAEPVHVLQIHGTADPTIVYDGGTLLSIPYPGAVETVEAWASDNECRGEPEQPSRRLNLDLEVPGRETRVTRYAVNCAPGGSAELWTIRGGDHVPALSNAFRRGVVEHLLSHPACRRERLKKVACNTERSLEIRLRRGVPGDAYQVRLMDGEAVAGELDARGRATLRLPGQPPGPGRVEVDWGCGATSSRAYECP